MPHHVVSECAHLPISSGSVEHGYQTSNTQSSTNWQHMTRDLINPFTITSVDDLLTTAITTSFPTGTKTPVEPSGGTMDCCLYLGGSDVVTLIIPATLASHVSHMDQGLPAIPAYSCIHAEDAWSRFHNASIQHGFCLPASPLHHSSFRAQRENTYWTNTASLLTAQVESFSIYL